jgi:type III pantothenate kinase
MLLIDIGNSAIKWTIESDGKLQDMSTFIYAQDELDSLLNENISIRQKLTRIYISNVAGKGVENILLNWCQRKYKLTPTFAYASKQACGLVNAYSQPEKLGIDRWLALIAANTLNKRPFCIADCGTAVTIDAVDENGQYLGGLILPGLRIMRHSLQQNTDAIQSMISQKVKNIFAKNTEQGVLSGTVYAITSSIENMIGILQQQTQQKVICYLTGGDAEEVEILISKSVIRMPDLVLQGLYLWGKEYDLDR